MSNVSDSGRLAGDGNNAIFMNGSGLEPTGTLRANNVKDVQGRTVVPSIEDLPEGRSFIPSNIQRGNDSEAKAIEYILERVAID